MIEPRYPPGMTRIRNCPASRERAKFALVCPLRWEALEATEAANVRRCEVCGENVYRCESPQDAEERAARGECVAYGVLMGRMVAPKTRAQ